MTEGLIQVKNLFGERYAKPTRAKKRKATSERAEAIRFFVETFDLNPKRLAPKLAHLDLPALYFLQSGVRDRLQRQNKETARKYFYWSIKVIPADNV